MDGPGEEVWAIVVAGGSGARFGGPKQFEEVAGRRVVDWSTEVAHAAVGPVVVVAPAGQDPDPGEIDGAELVVAGGPTRAESVRCGLAAVPAGAGIVVVHDAARPLASVGLFEAVIDAVRAGADAVTPVVPVTDTLRRRDGGVIDRDEMVAVQTPQAFRAVALREAHAEGDEATDDVGLVEAAGGRVVTVEGERWNLKVTTPEDLVVVEALLRGRGGVSAPSRRSEGAGR